jgi:hypothetical protein
MPETNHKKLIEAEVIDPASLPLDERDRLLATLYSVHSAIFDGVPRQEFDWYMIRPGAMRTRIQLYRNERGSLVGYCAIHLFEHSGPRRKKMVVLRAEAGLLPAYRGSASTLWFGAKEAFRYKLRHPWRPVVFFAMPVHPSSFHLISRYFWRCYPFPGRNIPKRWNGLLDDLARTSGVDAVDENDILIRHVGWITRDSETDMQNWRNSSFEDVIYYLNRNPGYSKGNGLAVIAPLSASNLLVSVLLYLFQRPRWLR